MTTRHKYRVECDDGDTYFLDTMPTLPPVQRAPRKPLSKRTAPHFRDLLVAVALVFLALLVSKWFAAAFPVKSITGG